MKSYKYNSEIYSSQYSGQAVYLISTDSNIPALKIDGLAARIMALIEELPVFTLDELHLHMKSSVPEGSGDKLKRDIESFLETLLQKKIIHEA